ncbi:MAG: EamA family transporter [Candidatus Firestonebacteria bacterium]|nr:EamA family transporter [Candidatus Firestonebacteria bacterium]
MQFPGYIYLIIIYLIWGTTYLAMRIGVAPHSGFPVFAFGAARCLVAAVLLLGFAKLRSRSIRPSRAEMAYLAFTGLGMWTFSHAMVLVAEQFMDSGFSAVAVATSPLWVWILGSWMDKTKPDWGHGLFVGIGFVGIAALMLPKLQTTTTTNLLSVVLLILSPAIWAYCALYVRKNPQTLSILTQSGYQQLFGGMGFLAFSMLFREPLPRPTAAAWGALGFLVVFGSIIAFTAYIKALSLLPAHIVTTNTYVNPVIAVILGWMILKESVNIWMLVAIVLVIISIAGTLKLSGAKAAKTR